MPFPSPYHGVRAVKGCACPARLRPAAVGDPGRLALRRDGDGAGQVRPSNRSKTMSQHSIPLHAALSVRDEQGCYQLATADQILEAARQVIDRKMARGAAFSAPAAVKQYLQVKLAGFEHEVFAVLLLDAQHRLIEYVEMFRGTIDSAVVHAREVVKEALRHNAAAVILAHNHPSGNPEPSSSDKALTLRLRDALALVEIRMLDHIVVGGDRTVAFAERGLL